MANSLTLIEESHNNPTILFSTVVQLTHPVLWIQVFTSTLGDEYFRNFLVKKVIISQQLLDHHHLLTIGSDGLFNELLNSFKPKNFLEMSSFIQRSKSTTCLLVPIPTNLMKSISPSLLDQITFSLAAGYVPAFKNDKGSN